MSLSISHLDSRFIIGAWTNGALRWKLHDAQRVLNKAFQESTNKLFVANCSRQWGKTYWGVYLAQVQARKYPKSQIRYGAAFQTDLLEYIIPAFDKFEEDCPEYLKSKKVGSKRIWNNGSVVKFVGLDKNPNGLRGNTLDLILLDEVAFVSTLDYIYRSIITPATLHRPKARIVMYTTPPATPAHDFCDYAQKAQIEGGYGEFTIDTNPLITEEQKQLMIKEMGGINSTTVQRELYCKFVVDSDLCLIPEWRDDYVRDVKRDEYYGYYHKYVGMDLGRLDHTAIIFGYYDFKKASLIIEDELTLVGSEWTTETLKKELLEVEERLWGEQKPFRRISDNNNPHLIIDLQSIHNISFIETDKESLEAMINEVRLLVGEGRILVNPKCTMLLGCLKYGIWDNRRKEFARSKTYGHFDMLAALVYMVRNLAKGSNPIPSLHGHDTHRSWTYNVDQRNLSANAKTIGDMFKRKI